MDFGIVTFPTDTSIEPQDLGPALEERGFESLFYAEHTHIPTSRRTPFIGGGDLDPMYWHCHDQFVALSMAAAVTQTLKLGTGVTLIPEHDAINMAKATASLDRLSGGRLIFGIGAGWNVEEMEDHGVTFKDRWKITRERVLAIKEIWNNDEPEFHGEFVDFPPMWSWPKPLQAGGPPILMGAYSKYVPARIAEYCDGWMPIEGLLEDVPAALADIQHAMRERGRDPASLDVTVLAEVKQRDGFDPERLERMVKAGANRVLLPLADVDRDGALKVLDDYATMIDRLSP
ncbi:MAG: LLM class F420-dependent oxidoreductase [Proteobacteria bacterium]|nr:LLM class F420-dependent oxidoreductase [Pseudomonadota bacterium]